MSWFIAGILVAVIGLTVALAKGRGGEMPAETPDRLVPSLPEGPLRPEDLQGVKFAVVTRGYDMAQVDALLERIADQLATSSAQDPETPSDKFHPLEETDWPVVDDQLVDDDSGQQENPL